MHPILQQHMTWFLMIYYIAVFLLLTAKRPSLDDGEFNAKKMRFDLTANMSFKSKLNEFCQKFRLPIPTYETVRNGKGFISTLIYNKKVYQSNAPQKTKKLAEQNAAQAVLHKLGQAPAPEPSLTDAIQKCSELCSQVNVNSSGTSATTNSEVSGTVKIVRCLLLLINALLI